jgi:hypothetical protein
MPAVQLHSNNKMPESALVRRCQSYSRRGRPAPARGASACCTAHMVPVQPAAIFIHCTITCGRAQCKCCWRVQPSHHPISAKRRHLPRPCKLRGHTQFRSEGAIRASVTSIPANSVNNLQPPRHPHHNGRRLCSTAHGCRPPTDSRLALGAYLRNGAHTF